MRRVWLLLLSLSSLPVLALEDAELAPRGGFSPHALPLPANTPPAAPDAVEDPAAPNATASVLPEIAPPVTPGSNPFPRPESLQPAIAFWTKVFGEYSEYQSVIHDQDDPTRVWKILDFRDVAQSDGAMVARLKQQKAEKQAKKDLDHLLARVQQLRDTPEKMNNDERQVYELLGDLSDPLRYKHAIGNFRAQRGLAERTKSALEVSGKYLPQMERIFADANMPTGLTRLPLVESSFNVEAYSKAGAAGLWQFIPSSARIYMRLNEVVDDRRDPWTSTKAAAAHLKDDYTALGDWPLAITAYNHGRGGIANGLRQINGKTLEDLVARWDGHRFGFASRNYYAEFVAASDVERDWSRHFGMLKRRDPLEFDVVQTKDYVAFDTLRKCAAVDEDSFRKLNPAFREEVMDGKLYVPPSSTIRVPSGKAGAFYAAYEALPAEQRFSQQRFYYASHRVQRGETLERIARLYGLSTTAMQQANGGLNPRRLRVGQTLRVPPHQPKLVRTAAPATAKPAVAAVKAAEDAVVAGVSYLLHKVQPGEALSTIADNYKTSVNTLRQLNNLGRSSRIRAGSTLKVPAPPRA